MATNVTCPIVSVICGTTGIILGMCSANENDISMKRPLALAKPILKFIPAVSTERKQDAYDQYCLKIRLGSVPRSPVNWMPLYQRYFAYNEPGRLVAIAGDMILVLTDIFQVTKSYLQRW